MVTSASILSQNFRPVHVVRILLCQKPDRLSVVRNTNVGSAKRFENKNETIQRQARYSGGSVLHATLAAGGAVR